MLSVPTPRPAAPTHTTEAVLAWTDGSSSYKDTKGGWAFKVCFRGVTREFYGHRENTTNNVMELTAVLRVLQFVRPTTRQTLKITTDSQYVLNAITKWYIGWERDGWLTGTGSPVQNKELIQAIVAKLQEHRRFREVEILWCKGHSGNMDNEIVDRLAKRARLEKITNWTEQEPV